MRALSVRRAWRAAWRSPGLTVLVVLTLSFGLAVWLAASSTVRAYQEDPLHDVRGLYRVEIVRYPELRRALAGTDMSLASETPQLVLSDAEVRALSHSSTPTRLAPATSSVLPVLPEGNPASLERTRFVGTQAFALFGLRLAAGRPFSRDDAAGQELILSHDAATRWFGGEQTALGKKIQIDGASWQVVGVLVERASAGRRIHFADGATDPALWLPYGAATALHVVPSMRHPASATNGGMLHASLWVELPNATALDEYTRFAAQVAAARELPPGSVRLRSYQQWSGVLGAPPAYRVFDFFGVMVLVACAFTLTRLLHTRFRLRTAELAVRRAVGASRGDVLGELFTEAGLVAALGAMAGVVLSAVVLSALARIFPAETPDLHLHWQRVLVGLVTGIGVGLAAAAVPAWRLCREPVAHALRRA